MECASLASAARALPCARVRAHDAARCARQEGDRERAQAVPGQPGARRQARARCGALLGTALVHAKHAGGGGQTCCVMLGRRRPRRRAPWCARVPRPRSLSSAADCMQGWPSRCTQWQPERCAELSASVCIAERGGFPSFAIFLSIGVGVWQRCLGSPDGRSAPHKRVHLDLAEFNAKLAPGTISKSDIYDEQCARAPPTLPARSPGIWCWPCPCQILTLAAAPAAATFPKPAGQAASTPRA